MTSTERPVREGADRLRRGVSGTAIVGSLALVKPLLHFLANGRYGYWIDELYFIACGEHLDWGYVDHPPLIAVVAKGSRWLLGDSLFAIRFFPAVAGALIVFLTGLAARQLGGNRFAQALAAFAVLAAPVYLGFDNLLTMNAFEPLFWMTCVCVVIAIVNGGDERLWLVAGVAAGIGMLNKHSIAFYVLSLIGGLVVTDARRVFRSKWLWIGGLVAGLIALPNLLWEAVRGWPTAELLRNATLYQHQPVSPAEFLEGQIQLMHPFEVPIWVAGFYFYLRSKTGQRYRCLGWSAALLFGAALLSQAKTYYLAPLYPPLIAAGGGCDWGRHRTTRLELAQPDNRWGAVGRRLGRSVIRIWVSAHATAHPTSCCQRVGRMPRLGTTHGSRLTRRELAGCAIRAAVSTRSPIIVGAW